MRTTYPVYTVVVFAGAPSSPSLTERYRWTFETRAAALRYARETVTTTRTDHATGRDYVPPCAPIFEEGSDGKLGAHVGERVSRARARYLARVAAQGAV